METIEQTLARLAQALESIPRHDPSLWDDSEHIRPDLCLSIQDYAVFAWSYDAGWTLRIKPPETLGGDDFDEMTLEFSYEAAGGSYFWHAEINGRHVCCTIDSDILPAVQRLAAALELTGVGTHDTQSQPGKGGRGSPSS